MPFGSTTGAPFLWVKACIGHDKVTHPTSMIITKKMTEWCDEKWPREIWTKEESIQNTDLKKRLERASIVEKMKPKISAAAILLGPKRLLVQVRSQHETTPSGLSNASF